MEKVYILANAKIVSPLSVASGNEEQSDTDIIRDFDGRPFLPGSSIAGAFRSYLDSDVRREALFGNVWRETVSPGEAVTHAVQSSVYVYDAPIQTQEEAVTIRESVSLSAERTANPGAKFNFEIIEYGKVKLRFEILQGDRSLDDQLLSLLAAVNSGEIRFGAKKNRGHGRLTIETVKMKRYKYGEAFYEFNWNMLDDNTYPIEILPVSSIDPQYETLVIPLKAVSSMNIRTYSALKYAADSRHISRHVSGGGEAVPVIPGTSWAGAFRRQAARIMTELDMAGVEETLKHIFGSTEEAIGSSRLVFGESELKDAKRVPVTRNKISRFTGGTMDGALFTEEIVYGGTCHLEIKIRKTGLRRETQKNGTEALVARQEDVSWLRGLLALVLMDLDNGFLPIGGEVSVGRGLFALDGVVREQLDKDYRKDIAAFAEKLGVKGDV